MAVFLKLKGPLRFNVMEWMNYHQWFSWNLCLKSEHSKIYIFTFVIIKAT